MTDLNPCQFCGEEDNIVIVSGDYEYTARSKYLATGLEFTAHVECHHCGAHGSTMIEDTLAEAEQRASDYWNDAYVPLTILDLVRRFFGQIKYDIETFIEDWKNDDRG